MSSKFLVFRMFGIQGGPAIPAPVKLFDNEEAAKELVRIQNVAWKDLLQGAIAQNSPAGLVHSGLTVRSMLRDLVCSEFSLGHAVVPIEEHSSNLMLKSATLCGPDGRPLNG